ncbi:MAG: AI-2E family transporter [Candidatus Melainabacteria bacterium]|nr:AI-2E family transporter [Candidatus Melainabacteria bacterium]
MLKWLATFLIIWFIFHIRSVFPPFVVAGIIAYLLLPLVNYIAQSFAIKRDQAVAILYLFAAGLLGILGWVFLPMVWDQFAALATNRREIITNVVQQAVSTFHWQLNVEETTVQVLTSIEEAFGKPGEIVHLGGLVSRGFLALLVCVVSSIYFIVDSQRVGAFCLRFVPADRRATVVSLSGQMNVMLSRYVRGQLVLIVIMSTVAWFFLHYFIHMKYALPIAIMSGFLEIIPVLGPIFATTFATLVGFAQYGPGVALGIIAFYTAARWIEDYLIVPKVIGHAVHLHPLIVIFAVLCGEIMAGALGMLIAIPVAASIKVIVDFTHPEEELAKVVESVEDSGKPQAAS